MNSNSLVCPGDACPLRFTCVRWHNWLDREDDDDWFEMEPDYHNNTCKSYIQKEFYGQ